MKNCTIVFLLLLLPLLASPDLSARDRGGAPDTPTDAAPVPKTEEPDTPRLELYGYLKLDASWDDSLVEAGNFARWVASPSIVEVHEHFNMTARQSRIGMRIGRERDDNLVVTGRVEMDFYGAGAENKSQPMLRHAYAELDWPEKGLKVTAGQTSDLISPLAPTTINYSVAWWAGNIGYRRPQLRVTKTVRRDTGDEIVLAAALSRSIGDDFSAIEPGDSGADSGIPAVQIAVSRRFPLAHGPAALGISGHWGRENLKERRGDPNLEFDSWSLNLDYVLPLSTRFTLKGELSTGQNLDDYLGGIGQGVNASADEAIAARGGWLAVDGRLGARASLGVGAGLDDPDDDHLLVGSRSKNGAVWVNVLYDIRSYLRTGFEISSWTTDYVGLEDASAVRVQGTLISSF